MQEERGAYRVRSASPSDDAALRAAIGTTLAHPEGHGHRESYRGAAERGEVLVLERFDRAERTWHVEGFVEHHLRVDDVLTLRDMGTAGEHPVVGVVRYLLDEVFGSLKPASATVKIRRDAEDWLAILQAIPGFVSEGQEYRRPHYWTIWRWDPAIARAQTRPPRPPERPRPPSGPGPRERAGGLPGPGQRGAGPFGPAGPRRPGQPGGPRPPGGGPGRGPAPRGPRREPPRPR